MLPSSYRPVNGPLAFLQVRVSWVTLRHFTHFLSLVVFCPCKLQKIMCFCGNLCTPAQRSLCSITIFWGDKKASVHHRWGTIDTSKFLFYSELMGLSEHGWPQNSHIPIIPTPSWMITSRKLHLGVSSLCVVPFEHCLASAKTSCMWVEQEGRTPQMRSLTLHYLLLVSISSSISITMDPASSCLGPFN